MQMPIPRSRSRPAGANPSPRFPSVVGQIQTRACLGQEVELAVVGVGRMDDGGSWAQAACTPEKLDRPDAVLLDALVDLARLLVGVDVEWQALPLGIGADLLEPVGRAGADGVGAQPTRTPASRSSSSCRKYSAVEFCRNRSMPSRRR